MAARSRRNREYTDDTALIGNAGCAGLAALALLGALAVFWGTRRLAPANFLLAALTLLFGGNFLMDSVASYRRRRSASAYCAALGWQLVRVVPHNHHDVIFFLENGRKRRLNCDVRKGLVVPHEDPKDDKSLPPSRIAQWAPLAVVLLAVLVLLVGRSCR